MAAPKIKQDFKLPIDMILQGDCIEQMRALPDNSIDLIFADPPYNLQLQGALTRPDQSEVNAVDDGWDQIGSFADYDTFSRDWLTEARRILKDTGTLWVIGSYHNIYRLGTLLMDLEFWILNDVIWSKTNPMPNFRGTRFQNATEIMLWAQKHKGKKYTFNYHLLKNLNDGKQMSNVWDIPLCTGEERLKNGDGKKLHSTQKPEALLYRVISSASNPGDIVLDPFFGTGTTGAVAKKLGRHFIGIEKDSDYIAGATNRINMIEFGSNENDVLVTKSKRDAPRVAFAQLIESGMIAPGQKVYSKDRLTEAIVRVDGTLLYDEMIGSIHQIAAKVQNQTAFNGWDYWWLENGQSIDELREKYRKKFI